MLSKPDNAEQKNIAGVAVHRYREKFSLSQQALVDLLNDRGISMTSSTISKIENGKRGINDYELFALAEIYGVSVDDMFR